MLPRNKNLKQVARIVRTHMTVAEVKLWSRIRRKQIKDLQFYRQKVIGNYIVDFYCHKARLVIEVDGGQHYTEECEGHDSDRDTYLNTLGLRVIRFSNLDLLNNIDAVVQEIYDHV